MRRRRRARRLRTRSVAVPHPDPGPTGTPGAREPARLPPARRHSSPTVLPGKAHPVPRRAAPTLTPSRLDDDDLARARRGRRRRPTSTRDDAVRMLHLGGKSTPDLLRAPPRRPAARARRRGLARHARRGRSPCSRVCDERGIAVVPFGGGTSVVGGVRSRAPARTARHRARPRAHGGAPRPRRDLAAGHLRRRHHRPAGRGAARRARLHARPLPAELRVRLDRRATRRRARAARPRAATADSTTSCTPCASRPRSASCRSGRAPASAAGPDLRELFLGSEGAFGVLTEVTVRIRPLPAATAYGAWTFPDFASGAAAFRELTQRGIRPTVLRLSDETETRVNAADGRAPHARARLPRRRDLRGRRRRRGRRGPRADRCRLPAARRDRPRRGPRTLLGARPIRLPRAARHAPRHRRARRDPRDRDDVGATSTR